MVYVHDRIIHPRENVVVIATHGRGMWALDVVGSTTRACEGNIITISIYKMRRRAPAGFFLYPYYQNLYPAPIWKMFEWNRPSSVAAKPTLAAASISKSPRERPKPPVRELRAQLSAS